MASSGRGIKKFGGEGRDYTANHVPKCVVRGPCFCGIKPNVRPTETDASTPKRATAAGVRAHDAEMRPQKAQRERERGRERTQEPANDNTDNTDNTDKTDEQATPAASPRTRTPQTSTSRSPASSGTGVPTTPAAFAGPASASHPRRYRSGKPFRLPPLGEIGLSRSRTGGRDPRSPVLTGGRFGWRRRCGGRLPRGSLPAWESGGDQVGREICLVTAYERLAVDRERNDETLRC